MRKTRIAVQLAVLTCFLVLVFMNSYPRGFTYPSDIFMRLDPYTALAAGLAARRLVWRTLPALAVLGSALVVGRAFCGWCCPMGTMLDGCSKALSLKSRPLRLRRLRSLKYLILVMTLVAAVFGGMLAHFFDPITIAERSSIFVVRKAVSAGVLGMSNLAPGSRALEAMARSSTLGDRFYSQAIVFAAFLGVLLALEAVNRRFWCRYVCPLGALISLVGWRALIRRRVAGCESTDICKRACVFGAVADDPRATRRGECALCLRCEPACPHDAISFGPGRAQAEAVSLDRRAVAAALLVGVVASLVPKSGLLAKAPRRLPIRPPGALSEDDFVSTCTRCGACIGACLTGGLQPAFLEAGFQGMWTPILVGRLGGCESECNLCGKVCNTQAIRYFPLAEKKKLKMGKAVIDRDLCLAWKEERVCYLCDEACPYGAIGFVREANVDFDKPKVLPDKCTGCGLCEWKCPVEPPAIYVVPLGPETS